MVGDYISREAILAPTLRVIERGVPEHDGSHLISAEMVRDVIKSIPAVDVVEVRPGRWMWDGGEDMHYYCSLCHHNAYGCTIEILDGIYRFCPSCGAIMDGGKSAERLRQEATP